MGEAVDLGMRPSAVLSKLRASASQCSLLLSRHRDSVAVHFTTILFYHFLPSGRVVSTQGSLRVCRALDLKAMLCRATHCITLLLGVGTVKWCSTWSL